MRRGAAISGGLHAALLVLAIFGADWFRAPEPLPLNVTEIDMVDGTELDARLSTAPVVQSVGPAELSPPSPGEGLPSQEAPPDPAAEPAAAAALAMATPPEPRPDAPTVNIPPPPRDIPSEAPVPTIADVPSPDPLREQSVTPESPPSTEPVQPLASVRPPSPQARPTPPPQAEPEPQPEPEPEPEPDTATVPQPTAPKPPEPAAQPEPTPETELAAVDPDAPQALAPREARLPVARPADRARAAPASSRPEPAPQQVAAEQPKPDDDTPQQQAQAEPQPSQPAGGSSRPTAPLNNGEKDALRLGIKKFYVYNGDRSDRSLQVTVRVNLDEAKKIVGKPEIVEATGGNPATQKALFDAGRRALIQAQSAGEFDRLPADKYAAWSVLNVVFTTEQEVVF